MATCPYCQSTVEDNNPVLLADKIDKALKSQWFHAEGDSTNGYDWPVGFAFDIAHIGRAEVVAKKIKADVEEFQDGYYYGGSELPQGTTFEAYVILKVGEHFYKKVGEGDSYSEITWVGSVLPVKPKTETRTVYVFE